MHINKALRSILYASIGLIQYFTENEGSHDEPKPWGGDALPRWNQSS